MSMICVCALNILGDIKSLQRKIKKKTLIDVCWQEITIFLQLHAFTSGFTMVILFRIMSSPFGGYGNVSHTASISVFSFSGIQHYIISDFPFFKLNIKKIKNRDVKTFSSLVRALRKGKERKVLSQIYALADLEGGVEGARLPPP